MSGPMDLVWVATDKAMEDGGLGWLVEPGDKCRVYTLGYHYGGIIRRVGPAGIELVEPHVVFDDDPAVPSYGSDVYRWPHEWIRIPWTAISRIDLLSKEPPPEDSGEIKTLAEIGDNVIAWIGAYALRGTVSQVGVLGCRFSEVEMVGEWPDSDDSSWVTSKIEGESLVPWHAILGLGDLK